MKLKADLQKLSNLKKRKKKIHGKNEQRSSDLWGNINSITYMESQKERREIMGQKDYLKK